MKRAITLTGEAAKNAALAWKADMDACQSCVPGNIVSHGTSYSRADTFVTYRCNSLSRWYNPATKVVEGRAHCTCDYCF